MSTNETRRKVAVAKWHRLLVMAKEARTAGVAPESDEYVDPVFADGRALGYREALNDLGLLIGEDQTWSPDE